MEHVYIYTKFKHTEAIVKILMLSAENSYTHKHTHTHIQVISWPATLHHMEGFLDQRFYARECPKILNPKCVINVSSPKSNM